MSPVDQPASECGRTATSRSIKLKRPKILVIGAVPPPWGGVEVVTKYLLESDLSREFELVLLDISKSRGKEYCGRLDLPNVTAALSHCWRLVRACRRERPELVYMPMVSPGFAFLRDSVFLLVSRLCRQRTLVHVHSNDFDHFYSKRSLLGKRLIQAVLGAASLVIVLSNGWYDFFKTVVVPEKLRVVNNAIDPELARRLGSRRPTQVTDGLLHVLFIGALGKRKGVHDLLRAASVLRHHTDVQFVLHLCGPEDRVGELEMLRQIWKEERLEDAVRFHGVVEGQDKARLLKEADILVLPSYREGMPLVLIEAFASGLPVVCTPVGAVPEMVEDGHNGLLVSPGDVQGLADRIERLGTDPDLRLRMGARSLERFRRHYTPERITAEMRRVFHDAMSLGKARSGPIAWQ